MMSRRSRDYEIVDVEARVRGNAGSAAISAAMLLLFGFFYFEGGAVGTPLFQKASLLFICALRFGGFMMIAVAVWSCFGSPAALVADAISAVLIGLLLLLSAGLMMLAKGVAFENVLYSFCGVTFIASSLRTWREYSFLPKVVAEQPDEAVEDYLREQGVSDSAFDTPIDNLAVSGAAPADQAEQVGADSDPIVFEKPERSRFCRHASDDSLDDELIRLDDVSGNPPPAPPGGFLADLAKEDKPKKQP